MKLGKTRYLTIIWLLSAVIASFSSIAFHSPLTFTSEANRPVKLDQLLKQKTREIGRNETVTVVIRLMTTAISNVQSEMVPCMLKNHASRSQRSLFTFLEEEKDAEILNSFWLVNVVLAKVTVDTLYRLVNLEIVEEVFENFEVVVPDSVKQLNQSNVQESSIDVTWGLDRIDVPEAWALGFNGSGIRVCVLDTGVDTSHPDLNGKMWTDDPADPTFPGGWIEFDWAGNVVTDSIPYDSDGHGTHTSGTVLGGNTSGIAVGVAQGAWLMHGLILPGGSGSFIQCIAGMQWAIDPFDQYGNSAGEKASITSMSWGAGGYYDEMIEPIQNMKAAGVVPVVSIGNSGEGLSWSPGNVYESFAVGAIDEYDSVALFSSGEVIDWPASYPESYMKPDFSAPGVSVYSCVPSNGWEYWSGTSMAAPHVAGTAALVLQANGNMSVDDVYEVLRIVADDLGDVGQDIRFGWGVINTYNAVNLALSDCGVEGYVTDAETSQPLEWAAQVTVPDVPWGNKNTSASGYYRIWLFPNNYSVKASAFGYSEENFTAEVLQSQWNRRDFSLTPTPRGFISGIVRAAETNMSLANATVTFLGTPLMPAITNIASFYHIEAPIGTYAIECWAWGYKPSLIFSVQVFENQTTTVDFQLDPTIKVAVIGDFRGQVTNILMRNISAHERDWDIVQDISNYEAVVVNIPSDPGEQTFLDLIDTADQYQVSIIFTNTYPGPWSSYGISLLHQYLDDPEGSYFAYWSGKVYYEVTVKHPIFEEWNVGDRIDLINGGDSDFAWFYRYSGVTIADIGSDSLGLMGCGVSYTVRSNGNVHLLLSGLSQSSYTNVNNAWTDDAKNIFRAAVVWVSEPVTLSPPTIMISDNAGPAGAKVPVNGSGFSFNSDVTVKFDDTPVATVRTNENGSFVAVFNIPLAEAGIHLIKAEDGYGNGAEIVYTVTSSSTGTDLLMVEVYVGSIHLRGEMAEFYALTTLNRVPVNVTSISAMIYKPDRTIEVLVGEQKATGTYSLTYDIPVDAPNGTYMLRVDASVNGVNGSSIAGFLVSPTLTSWNAILVAVKDDLAVIQSDIGTIKMNLTDVRSRIYMIYEDVAVVRTDIGQISVNLTSINAIITAVRDDTVIIKTDVGQIEIDVAYARSVIESNNNTLVQVQGDIATVKTSIGEIEGVITAIQDDMVTIETELGQIKVALQASGTGSGLPHLPITELLILFFFVVVAVIVFSYGVIVVSHRKYRHDKSQTMDAYNLVSILD